MVLCSHPGSTLFVALIFSNRWQRCPCAGLAFRMAERPLFGDPQHSAYIKWKQHPIRDRKYTYIRKLYMESIDGHWVFLLEQKGRQVQ